MKQKVHLPITDALAVMHEIHDGVGVVNLERVQVICPACGQQVEAVAGDGRVRGYCGVADVKGLEICNLLLDSFTLAVPPPIRTPLNICP